MPINASLFGHIQNDAFLSGTYKLEGHLFRHTATYLRDYLDRLSSIGELVNPQYIQLLKDMDYLVKTEEHIQSNTNPTQAEAHASNIAATLAADITALPLGKKLLIPGGWYDVEGGHSMVFEFTRHETGYFFTAFNAGAGIRYHKRKSATHKELYNPAKTWHFPLTATDTNKAELILFIARLLKARLATNELMSAKRLYEEVLPSIVYIDGVEQDNSTPDFAYTAGQFSGTCSQRSIHQMLKLNSPSLKEYQQFIFRFKLHALIDYKQACFTGAQPFNEAVAEQIHLAIENNLTILNNDTLFEEAQTEEYFKQLIGLKEELNTHTFSLKSNSSATITYPGCALIQSNFAVTARPSGVYNYTTPTPVAIAFNKITFLADLTQHVQKLRSLKDPALQYIYLEELLLSLPLNSPNFSSPPYDNLSSIEDYNTFYKQITQIQEVIHALQTTWVKDTQISKLNILALSALTLQTDLYNVLNSKQGMPSYQAFTDLTLQSMVGNQSRNPFLATNNPKLDANLQIMQTRFSNQAVLGHRELYVYFKNILKTNTVLNDELLLLYTSSYGTDITELHKSIRKEGLESLYLISLHIAGTQTLDSRFTPLIQKIKDHIAYEASLRRAINPFYKIKYSANTFIELGIVHGKFRVSTCLYPTFVPYQEFSQDIVNHKYSLKPSLAKDALEIDVPTTSAYSKVIKARTANHIQLVPHTDTLKRTATRAITQNDILARDYFHLRSNPEVQIYLTLDYFKRNIDKLADTSNQLYVEANLFQPGLLLEALRKKNFLSQLDKFLTTGLRFYTKNGQHVNESLFFLRLDFLVSNYLALTGDLEGIKRLALIQKEIQKQLHTATDPNVIYVLNQYLFLATTTKIQMGVSSSEELELALNAYFYIQSHTNPGILEDSTHKNDMVCAIARFQTHLSQRSSFTLKTIIEKVVSASNSALQNTRLNGSFPVYDVLDTNGKIIYQFNALLGKLFKNNLALTGVPLAIENHPLIKLLQLSFSQCHVSVDENYVLLDDKQSTQIFKSGKRLTVQQKWTVDTKSTYYELHALTKQHLAFHANDSLNPINSTLPQILLDNSTNYWRSMASITEGIIVQNQKPRYKVTLSGIHVINDLGIVTAFQLKPLSDPWARLLTHFENAQFILHHQSPTEAYVELPRFNLRFTRAHNTLKLAETNETVIARTSPIHPHVAGLVLAKDTHLRYLVPVARFYATELNATESAVYPVIHDTSGVIAQNHLDKNLSKLQHRPVWHYQNSEQYVSFRLNDGKPVADTTADALYLAYTYLATNQTQKAWAVLEECRTRLGGLTGSVDELKYISWICNDVPHVLAGQEKQTKKALRKTPAYIACKLKALSILCDFTKDNTFVIPLPAEHNDLANDHWAKEQQESLTTFLNALPDTIYQNFTRLQGMRRHLESSYSLSTIEKKRLLNYYHQTQEPHYPKGALGYEWTLLNLEILQQEQQTLLALKSTSSLSEIDEQRLLQIEQHFKELKPVMARSSALNLKPINLDLPAECDINKLSLSETDRAELEKWFYKLPGEICSAETYTAAIAALSSTINDSQFITYFPAYVQIATGDNEPKRQALLEFCKRTLIANRHITLENQSTNKVLLCNILYRALLNRSSLLSLGSSFSFNLLLASSRYYAVTPLKVYEAVNVYQDILATPEMILKQHRPSVVNPAAPCVSTYKPLFEVIEQSASLHKLVTDYNELNKNYEEAHALLLLKSTEDVAQLLLIEEQAGKNQLELEQKQIALAQKLINDPVTLHQIQQGVDDTYPKLELIVADLWETTLALANEGPADSKEARAWNIDKIAKKRSSLNKADLYTLYTRADLNYTIERTGLSLIKAQILHEQIHNVLVQSIQFKTIIKIQEAIKKARRTKEARDLVPALDLLAKQELPGLDKPAIILLQHEEGIILRPRQVSALQTLLKSSNTGRPFKETVEKIIPGGGKSKVILPILAEQKAQGTNLVVIEVPQALLATNHVDLNRISQRLFGKSAYRFEFNRDSDSSSKRLEQLYNQFIEVMTTRCYLVTAGESMQSLELKYLELLLSDEQDEEWEKQVYWCDKIINLVHHRGDAIIDEVHQGLWIKKKLNYTQGTLKPLSPSTIQNTVALFQYIDTDFIKTAPLLEEDYDWAPFQKKLADKLLNDENSPLATFVTYAKKKYGTAVTQEFFKYLTNQAEEPCQIILDAPAEIKASFAFFKQQINVLLPQTLVRRLDEKYGASKKPNLTAIERTLAIPYAANNIPNERSRFGNNLEAINCTCQMLLTKGISRELLQERIALWQAIARQELFQNAALTHIDNTPTARGFALQWDELGITLSQIKLDDEQQFNTLYEHFKDNRTLIFDLLQQQSLKLINRDSSIIHSDSFNHVDLYRTVQAVSGTPSNHTTYHQRLEYDKTSSLGTDGYIIELLRSKNTSIVHADYVNATQYINQLLTNATSPRHCRAIIDIRAAFQGIDNIDVARQLAAYIRTHQSQFSTPIKHVLYFNEQQILCALNIDKSDVPISLKTSDVNEINRLLGSTPNERFTYYDQVRTLGTDITQDEQAHALVLVDEKTSLQAFLQGSMRMRGIGQKQTIELVAPPKLAGVSRDDLIKKFSKTDQQTLLMDNLFAAKAQMANLIRRQCLNLLQKIPSAQAKKKAALAQAFKTFFIHSPSNDLFELYGALSKKQSTTKILAQYKEQISTLWKSTFKSAGIPLSESILAQTALELDAIIAKALPHCLYEYEGSHDTLAVEVEVQKEIQKEVEVHVASISEVFDPTLKESNPVNWGMLFLSDLFKNPSKLATASITINELSSSDEKPISLFSEQVRVSRNYAQSHTQQKKYLDAYLKPASLIWYHMEADVIHAMIITPQDLKEIQHHIENNPNNWIATTEETVIYGIRPEKINENASYQSIGEQIRFFNGEFNAFLNPEIPPIWINEHSITKLDFFEESILPYRPGCVTKFQELKSLLTESNIEGFTYIVDHTYEDLTSFDWRSLLPEINPAQALDYKRLADAFLYINTNWQTTNIELNTVQQRFRLSLKSLSYAVDHINHLKNLNSLINRVDNTKTTLYNLVALPIKEKLILEHCLGMTLDQFLKLYGLEKYTDPDSPQWSLAYIDLLEKIRIHPAINNDTQITAIYARLTQSSSAVVRYKLLEVNPTKDIINKTINAAPLDEKLINTLLALAFELTTEMLEPIAIACQTIEQISVVLEKRNVNNKVLHTLLQKPINKTILLKILSLTSDEQLLKSIYLHPNADKEIRLRCHTHSLFSSACLSGMLASNTLDEEELIALITDTKCTIVNAPILTSIAMNTHYSELVLLAVARHINTTPAVIKALLSHRNCSAAVVHQIMQAKGQYIERESIQNIALHAYKKAVASFSPNLEWEDCAIRAFTAMEQIHEQRRPYASTFLSPIIQAINAFDLIHHPKFSIRILGSFKKEVINNLPLIQMINTADSKEMLLLVNHQYTGNVNELALNRLYEKCSSPELIDLLLQRPDLSDTIRLSLLTNPTLNEQQLQNLIKNCKTDQILEQTFQHPQATASVRKALYAHPLFSARTLTLLLHIKPPSDEELLVLLEHSQFEINADVLQKISQTYLLNEAIQLAILSHPKTNSAIITNLLDNYFSSTELYIKILQSKVTITPDLLLLMATRAFDQIETKPTVVQKNWESCLLELFQYAVKANAIPKIVALIQKRGITPRIALHVLPIFSHQTLNQLPLPIKEMIALATEAEFKILVTTSIEQKLDQKTLLLMSQRCTTEELITLILAREDLNEEAYQSIIQQPAINSAHLVTILNKTTSIQAVFDTICVHPKVNQEVQKNIFTHPLRTSKSLLAVLVPGNSIEAKEILSLLLPFEDAVDEHVLMRISESFLINEHIVIAILTHPNITPEVLNVVLRNTLCSAELLQSILSQTPSPFEPHLLVGLADYVYEQCLYNSQPSSWQVLYLRILNIAKEGGFLDHISSLIQNNEFLDPSFSLKILAIVGSKPIHDTPIAHKLPLKKMLQIANQQELKLFLDINILTLLPEEIALILLKKCTNSKLINLFLKKPNLREKMLLHIFTLHQLNADHLISLLEQNPIRDNLLELAYMHSHANEKVRHKVFQHPSFSSTNLFNLLDKHVVPVSSMIDLLNSPNEAVNLKCLHKATAEFSYNPQVLHDISHHSHATDVDLLIKVAQKAFNLYLIKKSDDDIAWLDGCLINAFQQLIALNAHDELHSLIKRNSRLINAYLGRHLLTLSGTTYLPYLPLSEMIQSANEPETLTYLITVKELTASELELIARKNLTSNQIDLLLARQDITSSIATILFAKSEYNGQIKNWPWLTQQQLTYVLDHTQEYSSFNIALNHSNLTTEALNEWLAATTRHRKQMHQQLTTPPNKYHLLNACLEDLRLKAINHVIKARNTDKYAQAAQTAFELYQKLSQHKDQLFRGTPNAINLFVQEINDAKPVLEVHRGYKQIILDILNAVLAALTFGFKAHKTGDWRFFKANTDSINVVNRINTCIEEFNPSYPKP